MQKFKALEHLITLLPQLPEEMRRSLVKVLCESGLNMISRLIEEVGDARHPVDVAVAMIDVSLKAGHADVLNDALAKVDISWPKEVVIAFWASTAKAADQLPAREELWQKFESSVLPR
jgi:hypothetical protein